MHTEKWLYSCLHVCVCVCGEEVGGGGGGRGQSNKGSYYFVPSQPLSHMSRQSSGDQCDGYGQPTTCGMNMANVGVCVFSSGGDCKRNW